MTTNTQKSYLPHLLLLFAMLCWSSLYISAKHITDTVHPINIAFGRYFFASLFFLPFVFRKLLKIEKKDFIVATLVVTLAGGIATIFNMWGVSLSTASNVSIIVNTNPLIVAAFAPLLIKEVVPNKAKIGMIIGFLGLYITIFQGFKFGTLFESQHILGNAITFVSALCIAFGTIFTKKYIKKYGSVTMVALTFFSSIILLTIVGIVSGNLQTFPTHGPELFHLVYIGVIGTIIPFFLFYNGIKHIGASNASSYKMLIPIFTAVLAVLILKESLTPYTLIGLVATLSGVYLVNS